MTMSVVCLDCLEEDCRCHPPARLPLEHGGADFEDRLQYELGDLARDRHGVIPDDDDKRELAEEQRRDQKEDR